MSRIAIGQIWRRAQIDDPADPYNDFRVSAIQAYEGEPIYWTIQPWPSQLGALDTDADAILSECVLVEDVDDDD